MMTSFPQLSGEPADAFGQLFLHRAFGQVASSVRQQMWCDVPNRLFADEQNSGIGSSVWLTMIQGCSSKNQRHERRRIMSATKTSFKGSCKSSSHGHETLELELKSYWRWSSTSCDVARKLGPFSKCESFLLSICSGLRGS